MSSHLATAAELISGTLLAEGLPIRFSVRFCALQRSFLPKGWAGRGFRAISRNGRILLASDVALEELTGRAARIRMQTWHKAVLPGDTPEPYGILLCVRVTDEGIEKDQAHLSRLVPSYTGTVPLAVEVGGGMVLEFGREKAWT